MSSGNNQVTWRIVGQQPTMAPNPTGQYVNGIQVTFQTDTGLSGHIFIPHVQYNAANVAAAVAEQVRRMVQVHNLHGTVQS